MKSVLEITEIGMQAIFALGPGLAFLGLFIVALTVASWTKDLLTPKSLGAAMVDEDNGAVGVALAGYYIAVAIVFTAASLGPPTDLLNDLMMVGAYTLLGIVFLNLSRAIFERLLFRKANDLKEIVDNRNMAMAAVSCGSYIATGLVAGAAVAGQGGGWISSVAFFLLGQASLLLLARVYDWSTPYSVEEHVVDGNVAAGVAFSGTLIALGLILMHAAGGDFVSWEESITIFIVDCIAGMVALTFARPVISRLLMRGDLNDEIGRDRNLAAGFVEASALVAVGGVIAAVL